MWREHPVDIAALTRRVALISVDGFEKLPIEQRIVWLLLHDLSDRAGFKQLFSSLPPSRQKEIGQVWEEIVRTELATVEFNGSAHSGSADSEGT